MIKKIPSVVFSLLTLCALTAPLVYAQPASSPVPSIVYAEGSVSVNQTSDIWVTGEKGMGLAEGNSIKTADASSCDIALDQDKKNIISLGPNSEIKLGKDFKVINVPKGRVFAELKNLAAGSQFEIMTPQAVAGVRGTAWETIVDTAAKFNVKEHAVYVKGLDKDGKETGKNDVAEGYSIIVGPDGFLGELSKLTQEDWDRMNDWAARIERALGSSSSKNCSDLVNSYQGASANLFGQVLDCETGKDGAFASAGDGAVLVNTDFEQGITGGDITHTSFIQSRVTNAPAKLPDEPPTPCDCRASQGPNCSCD